MNRRWREGDRVTISDKSGKGAAFRVVRGSKFAGDLVIEMHTATGWYRVPFSVSFLLADFFSENERARKDHDPAVRHWRVPGDEYYAARLRDAIRDGWEPQADMVRQQRAELGEG